MDTAPAELYPKPSAPSRLAPWRLSVVDFGVFATITLTAIFAGTVVGSYAGGFIVGDYEGDPPNLLVIVATIGMQLGGLGGYLFFRRVFGAQARGEPLPFFSSIGVGLKWLLISYPPMMVVSYAAGYALERLGYSKESQEAVQMLLDGGTLAERWLMYASVVVVAPICEELVFRGGIFRFLFGRLSVAAAALISGALFAAMHANLYSFAPLAALGVGLALAYRESGSIVSAIAMHAVFNLITTLVITHYPEAV